MENIGNQSFEYIYTLRINGEEKTIKNIDSEGFYQSKLAQMIDYLIDTNEIQSGNLIRTKCFPIAKTQIIENSQRLINNEKFEKRALEEIIKLNPEISNKKDLILEEFAKANYNSKSGYIAA